MFIKRLPGNKIFFSALKSLMKKHILLEQNKISLCELKNKHLYVDKILKRVFNKGTFIKYDLERPFRFHFSMDWQCYICKAGIHFVVSNSSCSSGNLYFHVCRYQRVNKYVEKRLWEQMLRGLWVLAACFELMSPSIRFQVKILMTFQPHGA